MKQAIERSTRILTTLGPVIIVGGFVLFLFSATSVLVISQAAKSHFLIECAKLVLLGLVILAVGSFVRYLFNSEYRPSWMLRHIDLFLYLYAAFLVFQIVYQLVVLSSAENFPLSRFVIPVVLSSIIQIAWACILFGIAKITRITFSIIDESRTLV